MRGQLDMPNRLKRYSFLLPIVWVRGEKEPRDEAWAGKYTRIRNAITLNAFFINLSSAHTSLNSTYPHDGTSSVCEAVQSYGTVKVSAAPGVHEQKLLPRVDPH